MAVVPFRPRKPAESAPPTPSIPRRRVPVRELPIVGRVTAGGAVVLDVTEAALDALVRAGD
jgi:hypothetical protein